MGIETTLGRQDKTLPKHSPYFEYKFLNPDDISKILSNNSNKITTDYEYKPTFYSRSNDDFLNFLKINYNGLVTKPSIVKSVLEYYLSHNQSILDEDIIFIKNFTKVSTNLNPNITFSKEHLERLYKYHLEGCKKIDNYLKMLETDYKTGNLDLSLIKKYTSKNKDFEEGYQDAVHNLLKMKSHLLGHIPTILNSLYDITQDPSYIEKSLESVISAYNMFETHTNSNFDSIILKKIIGLSSKLYYMTNDIVFLESRLDAKQEIYNNSKYNNSKQLNEIYYNLRKDYFEIYKKTNDFDYFEKRIRLMQDYLYSCVGCDENFEQIFNTKLKKDYKFALLNRNIFLEYKNKNLYKLSKPNKSTLDNLITYAQDSIVSFVKILDFSDMNKAKSNFEIYSESILNIASLTKQVYDITKLQDYKLSSIKYHNLYLSFTSSKIKHGKKKQRNYVRAALSDLDKN